ncbi:MULTISPECIES: alpha/beta hydrolase [unclassified Acinetobacter]|uniref:alpha/beta hydrolase n=1 Tax=unclassified Acinetobacter TaxID=196816 RepID=UPI0029342B21|nr:MULTISPECIES: alpha/beta hydrolase [unclassified Acinetobacter]WOE32357.1 alpha/beta hydrolase [Acinetobacter sp. SAAs470]WOE37830.1 alpha/beta hydrolase [Acinetobacter sp. SAAs474]
MIKKKNRSYRQDILGAEYERMDLPFPDDEDGQVIATLIRKKAVTPTKKAVLYLHGFIDYFFQTEMAEAFNQHHFDFYALDLRKYGRSHLAHQKFYAVRNLSEYDAEISTALAIIAEEQHDQVILSGHSTGGLISTLYIAHHINHPLIKGLWLNSPFYDFNLPHLQKMLAIPVLNQLGKKFPDLQVPNPMNQYYIASLHRLFHGEWNFNLEWKKDKVPYIPLSFIHAIYEAQQEIHQGPYLSVPTLVMYSSQTTAPKQWNQQAQTSDIILNVKDIEKWAAHLKGHVTLCEIQNGIHDLVLSSAPVRKQVYQALFAWLQYHHL